MASPNTIPTGLTAIINGIGSERYVCLAEQRSNRLLVFDRASEWTEANLVWQFTPDDTRWSNLSDVRFRRHETHGIVALVAASGGSAGILRVTDAAVQDTTDIVWTARPGGNPHAIELIPTSGTIVTASSAGHLNVYPAPGPAGARPTQVVDLPGAHGLLWSPSRELLWATGDRVLLSYRVTGSGFDARLEPTGDHIALPGMGHDLQPDYERPGDLLVTDTRAAYRADPETLSSTVALDIASIKSYVRDSSGEAMWLRANGKPPRPWSSPVVSFDAGPIEHPEGQIYKARLICCAYE